MIHVIAAHISQAKASRVATPNFRWIVKFKTIQYSEEERARLLGNNVNDYHISLICRSLSSFLSFLVIEYTLIPTLPTKNIS